MKFGTFIAVDFISRTVKGANQIQLTLEEYLKLKNLTDPRNVIGPFELGIDCSDGKLSDKELHESALRAARSKQAALVQKLKK